MEIVLQQPNGQRRVIQARDELNPALKLRVPDWEGRAIIKDPVHGDYLAFGAIDYEFKGRTDAEGRPIYE